MENIKLGDTVNDSALHELLSNEKIFGVDLYEAGLAEKAAGYFNELIAEEGAVRATLKKYVG